MLRLVKRLVPPQKRFLINYFYKTILKKSIYEKKVCGSTNSDNPARTTVAPV